MRRLTSFLSDYRHYRTNQLTVYRLGRWESFWRAVANAMKVRK